MQSPILDRSQGFIPDRILDDHFGIIFHAEDLVVDGEFKTACLQSNATLDTNREHLSADLFSITSLMRAGSTDLLRECPAISGSSMETLDHLEKGLSSLASIHQKIQEMSVKSE